MRLELTDRGSHRGRIMRTLPSCRHSRESGTESYPKNSRILTSSRHTSDRWQRMIVKPRAQCSSAIDPWLAEGQQLTRARYRVGYLVEALLIFTCLSRSVIRYRQLALGKTSSKSDEYCRNRENNRAQSKGEKRDAASGE